MINHPQIPKKIIPNDPIIIYGSGNFGKELSRILRSLGFQIIAFLDQKAKPGEIWEGIPIFLPNHGGSDKYQKHIVVLIAIHNRDTNIDSIYQVLQQQGYIKIFNPVEYFDTISTQLGNRYWLTSPSAYNEWQDEITRSLSLWNDEKSRSLYLSLLQLRLSGNYSVLPVPDLHHQYFPPDLPGWKTPLRYIDCGAFDGDTLRELKNSDFLFESVIAFEPDLQNFRKLSDFVSREWASPAILFPCGVHAISESSQFSYLGNESARMTDEGSNFIQLIALDDVLYNFHPNFIKMDIEGNEMSGLMGAKKIIERDRPGLAICVYHDPQHLWKIPLLIDSWNLQYKFYLRSHAYNDFDVVLYAIAS